MKKNLLIFLLLLTNSVFALANNLPIYTNANRPVIQSANQPQFMIRLNSNPSTGYSWFLTSSNPEYVRVIQHQNVPAKKMAAGAGGFEEWTFELTPLALSAPHMFSVSFVYARPWEIESAPKTTTFRIVTGMDNLKKV